MVVSHIPQVAVTVEQVDRIPLVTLPTVRVVRVLNQEEPTLPFLLPPETMELPERLAAPQSALLQLGRLEISVQVETVVRKTTEPHPAPLVFVDSPPLETCEDKEDRDEDDAVAALFRAIDVAMGVDG